MIPLNFFSFSRRGGGPLYPRHVETTASTTYGITSVAIALRDLHRRADNVERLCYFRPPFFLPSPVPVKWNKGGDWRFSGEGEEKISINMESCRFWFKCDCNRFDYEEKNNDDKLIDLFYNVSFHCEFIFIDIPTIIDHLNFPKSQQNSIYFKSWPSNDTLHR